jgi:hypothetical protein
MPNDKPEIYEDGKKPVVFHYNRERRIKEAPQIVKDYYSGKLEPPKGFIKVLIATPARKMLFFSIIALCIVIAFLSYTMDTDSEGAVSDIQMALSAFSFEETVYISIQLKENSRFSGTKTVLARLSVINADNQVLETRELVKNYTGSEDFLRTTITDYDILRVEAVISTQDAEVTLKTAITRK